MSEELKQLRVVEMLRQTGKNTAEFMDRVADHIQKLEVEIENLQNKIAELERTAGDNHPN
jgi:uncharacterized protein involved in exopolysaccharide biosynthesis